MSAMRRYVLHYLRARLWLLQLLQWGRTSVGASSIPITGSSIQCLWCVLWAKMEALQARWTDYSTTFWGTCLLLSYSSPKLRSWSAQTLISVWSVKLKRLVSENVCWRIDRFPFFGIPRYVSDGSCWPKWARMDDSCDWATLKLITWSSSIRVAHKAEALWSILETISFLPSGFNLKSKYLDLASAISINILKLVYGA